MLLFLVLFLFKWMWRFASCYYSTLSWANIPLDDKKALRKERLNDLFNPNIPYLWKCLILINLEIKKRVSLEKTNWSSTVSAPVWPLSTNSNILWILDKQLLSLTSRQPRVNDANLYWMLMTTLNALLWRLEQTKNQSNNPLSCNCRSKPGWIWTCM